MSKFKKFGGIILLTLCLTSASKLCGAEALAQGSIEEPVSVKSVFSYEQVSELKKYIKEEFDVLYGHNGEITKLREERDQQKIRAERYKSKLEARKDYISPRDVQAAVNIERLALVTEFNKYLIEYSQSTEGKDKKLSHVNLTQMFQKFINLQLSVNLNNPGEVTVAQSAIQSKK